MQRPLHRLLCLGRGEVPLLLLGPLLGNALLEGFFDLQLHRLGGDPCGLRCPGAIDLPLYRAVQARNQRGRRLQERDPFIIDLQVVFCLEGGQRILDMIRRLLQQQLKAVGAVFLQ